MRLTEKSGRQVAPGVWQLKRDTFIIRAQPVDPLTGRKRNTRRVLRGVTRKEAILERERLLAGEADNDVALTPASPKLGTYAAEWLRKKRLRGDLESSTVERYERSLHHLNRQLRDTAIDRVRPAHIEDWMLSARSSKQAFAPSTINSWRRVLRTVLNDAVAQGLITANPVAGTRPLRVEVDLEQPNALPPTKLVKVLRAIEEADAVLAAAAWTQAFTGLRWQEVSALRWDDFDAHERTLTIRRKVVGGELVPSTKTKRLRIVGVPLVLVARFAELDATLETHPGRHSDLMFPSRVGTPLASARVSAALRKACRKVGIKERFTSHGLRRSMTDLLREAQVDPVVAKAIVGHSTDRMREHYSTVRAADARLAGDRVEAILVEAGL